MRVIFNFYSQNDLKDSAYARMISIPRVDEWVEISDSLRGYVKRVAWKPNAEGDFEIFIEVRM